MIFLVKNVVIFGNKLCLKSLPNPPPLKSTNSDQGLEKNNPIFVDRKEEKKKGSPSHRDLKHKSIYKEKEKII